MRLIKLTEYCEESMQLAKSIYDGQGRMLLSASQRIHPKLLERLKSMGISHLVVEDAESKGIALEELMDMPTWLDIIHVVQEAHVNASSGGALPVKKLRQAADTLIQETKRRSLAMSVPSSSITSELQLYAHEVNVALIALQMARRLEFSDQQLNDLAIGCMLHDIGKSVVSDIKDHPLAGFNTLRSVHEFSLLSAHVAFQHHERLDGTGAPRGIEGTSIHEYALICGTANLYDNLVSRHHMSPHDAVEAVMAQNDVSFPEKIVRAFVQSVAPYPPGTKVRLNNGEEAIITAIDTHMLRPVVRYLSSGEEISLVNHPTLLIAAVS